MDVKTFIILLLLFIQYSTYAQNKSFASITSSVNSAEAKLSVDNNPGSGWKLTVDDLRQNQSLMLTLQASGDVKQIQLTIDGVSRTELQKLVNVFVTYDPVNLGDPVAYKVSGEKNFVLDFSPKYGAHIKIEFKGGVVQKTISVKEINLAYDQKKASGMDALTAKDRPWMNASLSVNKRVELLLSVMTPEQKMELLREGWGIPGIPALGIPPINKVEAIHGYSYGSGATIFPQSIALGASWNKKLVEHVAEAIAEETASAHTAQAWSPVLDVAQDARWGRCEETYGEDPILVSEIGGSWIKGFQSKGLLTTPKHFAAHGAPLGGRDSHDIGLSEREMREIHLVPFRNAIKKYNCQSIMENYSDYLGVPIAKSRELLKGILREEWGFDGFIVSDCGALRNLTNKKHYTAETVIDAANQALAAGICTNCGNVYNDKAVIEAAKNGGINIQNLNFVCRTLLSTMFRNGFFEHNPSKPLDWNKIYPGWNSPDHREVALQAAREAIVMLENKNNILPLTKSSKTIAVIGPGADDLQPGDYTAKLQPNQLISVLSGIKSAVGSDGKVLYEKGCEFLATENFDLDKALQTASAADVVVMVLGDCSTSEGKKGVLKTSGEANDYASLVLPGNQQKLLEAVCKTGKPVILMLQAGRPYDLSYAAEHCSAILVNWLPGQEGGTAAADVLFGKYNPAGRLPMTFPRNVAQLPLYYNFKTSGRGYKYVDMPYYPLYSFGYGLSYTTFSYSDLKTQVTPEGNIDVTATVTNTGKVKGDEVAQLYVTDMYASVKTRVMELKDFERLSLMPGQSTQVKFTLTPYQLSLLNDNMDRVVEPGDFKIMVGSKSPEYVADDQIKNSVGYKTASLGVNSTVNYKDAFKANFEVVYKGVRKNPETQRKEYLVSIKNSGNLTDVGKISMYVDGTQSGELHNYELDTGQQKVIAFDAENIKKAHSLTFTTKYKIITQAIK